MNDIPANSSFFSGTKLQFAWDSTSLGTLKSCPRKYLYSVVYGYQTSGESIHLTYGLWVHSAFELFEKRKAAGDGFEAALRTTIRAVLEWTWVEDEAGGHPWTSHDANKTRDNLIRTIIWYCYEHINDPAETVILPNGKPAVELTFRFQLDNEIILCGHLDRLVSFQDQTFVMDHKTTKSTISDYYFDQYKPSNQMTLYTAAGKVVYEQPVNGVIINAIQIAVGFTRFARGITYRTNREIAEYLETTKWWIAQAHAMAEADNFPMNDTSCHDFGGCPFRKVCASDPGVRQATLDNDYTRRVWDPLVPR